jgi:hypothetical protein
LLLQRKIDSARAHWISIIPADENEPTIHHDVGGPFHPKLALLLAPSLIVWQPFEFYK